jgi:NADH-quinone oxidoreductase subunit E
MKENLKLDEKKLDRIIKQYANMPGEVLSTLEAIQEVEGYIPKQALKYVSEKTGVPLSRLYSICTFYTGFSLKPRGKHIVTVCEGTACHVKGASRLLTSMMDLFKIKPEDRNEKSVTTEDRMFTIVIARCLGCCSLAPVIIVDGNIYGSMTTKKMPEVLKKYEWKEK